MSLVFALLLFSLSAYPDCSPGRVTEACVCVFGEQGGSERREAPNMLSLETMMEYANFHFENNDQTSLHVVLWYMYIAGIMGYKSL